MPVMAPAVGERIRLRRQQLGLRQKELAARVGVSPSAVLDWEKNRYFPSRHQGALEDVLGISLTANGTPAPPADPIEREMYYRLMGVKDMTHGEAVSLIEGNWRAQRRIA